MYYLKYLKERRNNLNFYIMNSFVKGDSKFIPKTDGYNKNALIRKFIDEYRKKVKRKLKVRIFICVPELSTNGSFFNIDEKGRFLTFVIYLENVLPERIGLKKGVYIDNNHDIVKIFYKTLKKYRLPGIDKSTRIKFFITNYQDCYEGKICFEVEEELALRHARAPRYVRRGRTGVVIASEHLDRRVNDGAPAVLGKTLEALEPT